ncbi:polysaccharide deacetylase family protein [Thiomonas bhubaneswarensis]|uniref:Peptidoglycan/xylan/chitin deacetylase, PgdA/CDA1 family n=1 Tax=Thiomonas bhubaneswarensis TaxID=339866 RepID=A0A0K6I9B4_9BURK|nr:polysaccharide deacetylase family protein [Thiomonas bhubaneswarensis]CUA99730.1 Peptidoglycan/xylan/chitin deacetylase, PgdA/CDA1 family [Thiomonas bhubaneswarensis]
MPTLALKVDVDTLRGTLEGVPALLRLLDRHQLRATFLFSLGPDHTGRALKRVFRPGFLAKVRRTSVTSHYGLKTLLYGTLLPGPDIGRRAADPMRDAARSGHETGVHTWDHILWQDAVVRKSAEWTRRQLQLAVDRYGDIFGQPPQVHGAAGWQMNDAAYLLEQELGFTLASDGRGIHPFLPVVQGQALKVPQLPTTLPTLDELIGVDGLNADNVADHLLRLSTDGRDHVYTLHAELEGGQLASVFDRLLHGWKAAGLHCTTMRAYADTLNLSALPHHAVGLGSIPGRSGTLAVQGEVQ